MLSTSWKTHLAIRSGFCRVSGNIEFTAGIPSVSLRGWAGFINLPHKEVSLFRKYCQYWRLLVHTKRKTAEEREFERSIVGCRYYIEDNTLFMMQRREGYKKYCDALSRNGFCEISHQLLLIRILILVFNQDMAYKNRKSQRLANLNKSFDKQWRNVNITFQIVLSICQLVVVATSFSILFLFRLNPLLIPFSPLREAYFLVACQVQDSRWQRNPCTSSPPMNIWSDVSAWYDIFHLQDYVAATSFSCVTSPQFAKYHVSRANDRCRREIMHILLRRLGT